ncbi:MAG: D-glycero-beta-D-manno-heptose-7-phosphate kinase [Bacteroidetes bacterium 4572_112]|nr:MAG: D-glycero-beta-D-manno-heptose-7-phosphate kinase [Bacteroidetes bacterium 4572_112]
MTTKAIDDLFKNIENKNVLIIGDVMVDAYLMGSVDRISPEAPVPVVSVEGRKSRMGGAANVALNISALGATPFLCSVIGSDVRGDEFIELMAKRKMSDKGIVRSKSRPTTTKFRIIGNNVQMLRVDEEVVYFINRHEEKELLSRITDIITDEKIDAIIFEDYDKGSISPNLIKAVVKIAKKKNIIVTVDPKKRNFKSFSNLTLLKPNFKELKEGCDLDIENGDIPAIRDAAMALLRENNLEIVMVTLSEHGILICERNLQTHIPAIVRSIADVSGAGDTVISVLTLALASGIGAVEAAKLSNLAGGLVCEVVGVAPIDKKKLKLEAASILL